MGLIWSTFYTSLWVDDFWFIGGDPIIIFFYRYLLLGVSGWPTSKENFSLWSVYYRIGSSDLVGENGVHRICCWFWKFWGSKYNWPPLARSANTKFYRYVFLILFSWPCVRVIRLLTSKSVTAIVQLFYAYRIKLLADNYIISSVVVLVNFSSSISNEQPEWLINVSIWLVCFNSTWRGACSRGNWDTINRLLQPFGQEDTDSIGCMCSMFPLEHLAILPNFIDLEW